jgi:GT2 family glycosyltransferase
VPSSTPDVSVVIPSYRRSDRLPGLLGALAAQTLDPGRFEVVVIDNASGDDTYGVLLALSDQMPFAVRVLQIETNHGPAPARNLGWQSAISPVVAFLDDDCLPEPKWLECGLAAMELDEHIGVIQGRVRPPLDFNPAEWGTWYHCQILDGPSPYFEAANIFYRRAALLEAGGFDEQIGWWCEDTSLGWKVVDGGWRRAFAADAVVEHEVTPRGWRWHYRNGFLEVNSVRMAAEHPGFRRDAFWRSWAYRREDAVFVIAVAALLVALRFRPALLLALPYLWWRRPRRAMPAPLTLAAQTVAVDAARSVGQLRGAVRSRTFII